MSKFTKGEIVNVSNPVDKVHDRLTDGDIKYKYTQQYVAEFNGIYYCARDDGDTSELIGWLECETNKEGYKYYTTEEEVV